MHNSYYWHLHHKGHGEAKKRKSNEKRKGGRGQEKPATAGSYKNVLSVVGKMGLRRVNNERSIVTLPSTYVTQPVSPSLPQ